MNEDETLPGFDDRAPADRFCDLVLTGGVTSAVAYPPVVFSLAQAYRLKSIGGSSSGAGSAALAAAAEFRRRRGSVDGFRTLLARTRKVAESFEGRCGLEWLFQPEPGQRRLFSVLLRAFAGPDGRMTRLVWDALQGYREALEVGALVGGAVLSGMGAWLHHSGGSQAWSTSAWLIVSALFALGAAIGASLSGALSFWADVKRAADNDYGLCTGQYQAPGAPHLPLTAWLHALLQDVAGLPHDRPLSFVDLHLAPGGQASVLGQGSPAPQRSIDLRMFASNLSLGRPLLLPQSEDDAPLFFRPIEMRRLFPGPVVTHMKRAGGWAARASDARSALRASPMPPEAADEIDFFCLPRNELPVLVAARMSVGFPILFSAVPLWELEPEHAPGQSAGRRFRRLLFADGGLCSNFPIHLFDRALPSCPTFGVALHDVDVDARPDPAQIQSLVRVNARAAQRPPDRWSNFDESPGHLSRLLGFVGAMFSTMKDWNDAIQAELPGVRDRVAYVGLPKNIGGLNVRMSSAQILWLAHAGGEVARQLLERYATPAPGAAESAGWREHRWVRLNILAEALQDVLSGVSRAAQGSRYAAPLRQQIQDAIDHPPLGGGQEHTLRPAEAAELQRTLEALIEIEQLLQQPQFAPTRRAQPRPELRLRAPM